MVGTTVEHARRPLLSRGALFQARSGVSTARGNQRELAHQKNMKKSQEISKGKGKEDSLTTSQRKQRDSEIMQQKQKAANEKKSMQTREK
ncbi:small EDRK-rich factor 1-like [Zalophus californianus]|uniref:Small EDRK-rich factor 1-like n=1 Tax=Zalophus californianus TaxID=9704 RepID=A0A6P9EX22_ZALCA|nr:small EDRK-rich factor 1-like [Zalophus californianus]